MAGRYGMSFATKMIQEGKYAEAIEEATRAVARDEEDPAPLVERASAYAWLERYPEAVKDLEAAIALDEAAGVLETDVVDDAYFSALLGAAKLEARNSLEAATQTLVFGKAGQITTAGYVYDARGRLTAAPGGVTYGWDAAARLTNANGVTLAYNGFSDVTTRTERASSWVDIIDSVCPRLAVRSVSSMGAGCAEA